MGKTMATVMAEKTAQGIIAKQIITEQKECRGIKDGTLELEYINGIPVDTMFKYQHKIALVIVTDKYDEVRKIEGRQDFADLPDVKDDKV